MFLLLRTSEFTVRGDTTFKKEAPRGSYYKAEFKFPKNKRSTDNFVRTPFYTPCPARNSVLHLFDLLTAGNISEMFCYHKT